MYVCKQLIGKMANKRLKFTKTFKKQTNRHRSKDPCIERKSSIDGCCLHIYFVLIPKILLIFCRFVRFIFHQLDNSFQFLSSPSSLRHYMIILLVRHFQESFGAKFVGSTTEHYQFRISVIRYGARICITATLWHDINILDILLDSTQSPTISK